MLKNTAKYCSDSWLHYFLNAHHAQMKPYTNHTCIYSLSCFRENRYLYLTKYQTTPAASASPNTISSQSSVTDFAKPITKYNSTDPRQVDITDALILYIAGESIVCQLCEKTGAQLPASLKETPI